MKRPIIFEWIGRATDILEEFVEDVDTAYAESETQALSEDWPDLQVTYDKAVKLLKDMGEKT